jgi:hypothetical protein
LREQIIVIVAAQEKTVKDTARKDQQSIGTKRPSRYGKKRPTENRQNPFNMTGRDELGKRHTRDAKMLKKLEKDLKVLKTQLNESQSEFKKQHKRLIKGLHQKGKSTPDNGRKLLKKFKGNTPMLDMGEFLQLLTLNVPKQYPVTYDSADKMFIMMHRESAGKPNLEFRMHESGLHYYDPRNEKSDDDDEIPGGVHINLIRARDGITISTAESTRPVFI